MSRFYESKNNRDIRVGSVVIVAKGEREWVLPGGETATRRNQALAAARRLDAAMGGQACKLI